MLCLGAVADLGKLLGMGMVDSLTSAGGTLVGGGEEVLAVMSHP